jgi:hypothetical protein
MRIKKQRRQILFFLALFLFVTAFINFFHTDEQLNERDDCPACHFLNSTFTTNQIDFFFIPPPVVSGLLESRCFRTYRSIAVIHCTSRSPPQA